MDVMMRDALERGAQELGWLATRVAIGTIVVVIALALNGMLRRALRNRHTFMELPAYGQTLILNTVTTSVAVVACTAILALWGVTWATIAAGIGLSTLAIALGLQDVLKSLAGGVVIMLERPFDIGDRIRIKDLEGEVIDMRVRSVVLRMDDNHLAQAPNGLLFSETFENLSRTEAYSYTVTVSGIDEEPATARASIREALKDVTTVPEAPEIVLQREFIPTGRWPGRASSAQANAGATREPQSRSRHRALIAWQSECDDASLARVLEVLSKRFPTARVEIRKR